MKLKVLELFGGIGACSKALERLGVDYEVVDYVEIDKYAVESFNAIHGTNFEPQDICEWDKEIEADLIMHGSPCQDFSVAGLGAGGDEGSGTRSSLMYETIRIVDKLRPKYVLWENVKNLLSKKHRHNFDAYLEAMEKLGYKSYYKVLNAKDFGVPQNRERVYTISIRADIPQVYDFPQGKPLTIRLKDILESNVDEKYYLSEEQVNKIKLSTFNQARTRIQEGDISQTLCARDYKDPKCVEDPKVTRVGSRWGNHQAGQIYDKEGLSPTLDTGQGGSRTPLFVENPELQFVGGIGETDRVGDGKKLSRNYPQGNRVWSVDGIAVSQTAQGGGLGGVSGLYMEEPQPVKRRRSEYGKEIRKAYENHEVEASEDMRENYLADDGVMPTITASRREQKIAEPYIAASRGRGENNEQHLEPNHEGTTNTITTVAKDNYVVERAKIGDNEKEITEYPSIVQKQGDRGKNDYSVSCDTSYTVTANPMSDRGQMVVEKNLKTQLCDRLVKEGIVHGGEIVNHSYTTSKQRDTLEKYIENKEGIMPTITTRPDCLGYVESQPSLRIRKLTPKETWRLMGFDDDDFEKAQEKGVSNSQLYKQAGNSIVVNVLESILKNLIPKNYYKNPENDV